MDDKVTFHYPPNPNASPGTPNDASSLSLVSTVSNYPYYLRNFNKYFKIALDTKKTGKELTNAPTLMTLMLMKMMFLVSPILLTMMISQ